MKNVEEKISRFNRMGIYLSQCDLYFSLFIHAVFVRTGFKVEQQSANECLRITEIPSCTLRNGAIDYKVIRRLLESELSVCCNISFTHTGGRNNFSMYGWMESTFYIIVHASLDFGNSPMQCHSDVRLSVVCRRLVLVWQSECVAV